MMIKNVFSILLLSLVLLNSCADTNNSNVLINNEMERPRIVNIINFIRLCEPRDEAITEEVLFETVVKQVEIMTTYKLGGTFLLQYDALMDSRYQVLLKSLPADSFEIGAWWEIPQPLVENAGLKWRGRYPWDWHADVGFATGYTPEEREKLVDVYMADFKHIFGYYPKSVGSWFIDAHTLNYLSEKYGIIASCNCKDQIGTDGYSMWGGYWNQAYYPSKKNAYMPAQNEENQIPVPIFRMLGSDPIRQYELGLGSKRQYVMSLEPVYPESGRDTGWVNWYFNQFVEGECMEYAYVQVGQENSFTWDKMSKGYDYQIPLIAKLRNEKKIKVETLAESGQWFREKYKTTPATSVTIQEDLNGSDKKTVWFNSRYYRVNLFWKNNTLRFRDIHVFDENLASEYLTEKGTSTKCDFYTLPVVDGFNWSSVDDIAGLYFKTFMDGKEVLLEGGIPEITNSEQGELHISWPLKSFQAAIIMKITEEEIKIEMEGDNSMNWFLDLTTNGSAELPFRKFTTNKIECRFKGMDYSVLSLKGAISQAEGKTIFRITPEENSIEIKLSQNNTPVKIQ